MNQTDNNETELIMSEEQVNRLLLITAFRFTSLHAGKLHQIARKDAAFRKDFGALVEAAATMAIWHRMMPGDQLDDSENMAAGKPTAWWNPESK